jgi:hypothetical protein
VHKSDFFLSSFLIEPFENEKMCRTIIVTEITGFTTQVGEGIRRALIKL